MKLAWNVALGLVLFAGTAFGVDPCSTAGQEAIRQKTPINRPADGNLDQVDLTRGVDSVLQQLKDVNLHADQCRAVLGPLPSVSCPDAPIAPVTVNGKVVTYENGVYYMEGKPTTWRPKDGCDHPGVLALLRGSVGTVADPGTHADEGCIPNARLGHLKMGNVDWVFSCHFFEGAHEKTDKFEFLALIGSNRLTGETCFFSRDFQLEQSRRFHAKDAIPPGGRNPHSPAERAEAKAFWNPIDIFVCMECHGNNKPFLITPHVNQQRVAGDGTMEFIPEVPLRTRLKVGWGYRVIGTGNNYFMHNKQNFGRKELKQTPVAIYPKNDDGTQDRSCTRCHLLTDQENYLRLARLAVGLGEMPQYHEITKNHVRDPKPWMPPGIGDDANELARAQAAVKRYERALKDPKWRFKEEPILSPCPKPAALASAKVGVVPAKDGVQKVVWNYRNDYGDIPLRDDVRFKVKITDSKGKSCEMRDIAPSSLGSDDWALSHPVESGVDYKYEIQPYRYCFDQTIYQYSEVTNAPAEASR